MVKKTQNKIYNVENFYLTILQIFFLEILQIIDLNLNSKYETLK